MDTSGFYIQEALTQLIFAKKSYVAFEQAEMADDVLGIFFNLHHFLMHIANVDKLLNPKPDTERQRLLANRLNLSNIDLKSFRKLRNHLEHLDERLDMWVAEYDGHAFFDMNIVTGTKGFPKKAFLRALDGKTFLFHGEAYPLEPLCRTIEELQARLNKALAPEW